MGLFDWFRKPKGRELWLRPNYTELPQETWTDDEYDHWFLQLPEEDAWAEWDAWSKETRPHPNVKHIRKACLEMALEAARGTDSLDDPREFACLLDVRGDTIEELVLLPGTIAGDEHAIFDTSMAPADKSVRGSLHSHPDEHPYPSDADLELFAVEGEIHLILCRPYGPNDWRAYDQRGIPTHLDVVP
ncbi:MAG: Mov34/MPN/PAD-1 family protein [Thermoplasmatota archaeon]